MFDQFYNIPEQPFDETPDPRFLYLSSSHSETLLCLQQNAASRKAVQAVIAPAGYGKTTLMYAILDRLQQRADTAFIPDTSWGATSLLGFLLTDLGVHDPGPILGARRDALQRFLLARPKSKSLVIVLDQAHTLDRASLEELDTLLAHTPACLQVILAGRNELTDLMNTVRPSTLPQRVAATCRLGPLDANDTAMYIRHRLHVAGYSGGELFTAKALQKIAAESYGVPLNINNLCARALKYASERQKKQIDEDVIREVASRSPIAAADASDAVMEELKPIAAEPSGPSHDSASATSVTQQDQNSRLADLLRSWLGTHSGVWSGTVSELYEGLQSTHAAQWEEFKVSSAEELNNALDWNAAALKKVGIQLERRARAGRPRLVVLRIPSATLAA